jgi:hypothetical protein
VMVLTTKTERLKNKRGNYAKNEIKPGCQETVPADSIR